VVAQLPHITSPLFGVPHGTLLPSTTHNEWPLAKTLHFARGTLKGTQVRVGHVCHYCHLGPNTIKALLLGQFPCTYHFLGGITYKHHMEPTSHIVG